MQSISLFIVLCFAAFVERTQSIKCHSISRNRMRQLSQEDANNKFKQRLLEIANKSEISILEVDHQNYRPPYLKTFCKEINSLVKKGDHQTNSTLRKIAKRFKETVYTQANFPHTYRPEAKVRINNEELLQYRREYCSYRTEEELKRSDTVFIFFLIIIFLFAFSK